MEFLSGPQGIEMLARMGFGFIAAAVGIALWAHTREPAWILVVSSTLLGYVEVLLRFLDALGVISLDAWVWMGLPIVRVGFAVGVPLTLTLGLAWAIRSFRRP